MSVTLTALAVWCVLSLVFAGAHCRWCRYADVPRFPMALSPTQGPFVQNRREVNPVGSEVSIVFGSYARL